MALKGTITLKKEVKIPIHHDYVGAKEFYRSRADFYTNYEMSEPNEIGCVYDVETGKPIMRVVCDLTTKRPA